MNSVFICCFSVCCASWVPLPTPTPPHPNLFLSRIWERETKVVIFLVFSCCCCVVFIVVVVVVVVVVCVCVCFKGGGGVGIPCVTADGHRRGCCAANHITYAMYRSTTPKSWFGFLGRPWLCDCETAVVAAVQSNFGDLLLQRNSSTTCELQRPDLKLGHLALQPSFCFTVVSEQRRFGSATCELQRLQQLVQVPS